MTEKDKLTEERIFDAAIEVFLEKGMDGARMQNIAEKADLNKALLHYYYRTKEKLFTSVFEAVAKKLFGKFTPLAESNLSLEEKIRFFFREHIAFLQANPRLPGFIINEVNRNPERIKKFLVAADIEGLLKKLYEMHRKEFEAYNITEDILPQLIISMAAISVFPFAAKGLLEGVLGRMGTDFNSFIEIRKQFAADFVIRGITTYK
jgi:TetR/AcrR family transcriptional regulator